MMRLLAALLLAPSLALAQGVDPSVSVPTVFPTVDGNYSMSMGPPQQVFWDDFGTGTLDTTNRWNAPTTGGGGNATGATNAVGQTTLGSGNQASGWSILQSQVTFAGRNPGFITAQYNINFEFPVLTNAYRAWGFYSAPGGPTTSAPLANAVVFAIDTAGKLRAQTWASGALNFDQDLSVASSAPRTCNCVAQPTDNRVHRYQIAFRGDNILWFVDNRLVAYVLTGSGGPDVNTIATGALAVAGTTPPSASATLQLNQVTLSDTGNNSVQISDGTYAWRRATVAANGTIATSVGSSAAGTVGAGYPNSATPITSAGTGTTAAVTATLAAAASKYTYICGFSISADATALATGSATITGIVGGTFTYQQTIPAATNGSVTLQQNFTPCIPGSAVNTAIVVTSAAAGTGGVTDVNAWGFQQ